MSKMIDNDTFSFLQARDPSILTGHLGGYKKIVKKNLLDDLNKVPDVTLDSLKEKHLEVFLRVKPENESLSKATYKIKNENTFVCHVPSNSYTCRNNRDGEEVIKEFMFNNIFDKTKSQTDIFNMCVRKQIFNFINGENSTLMTYGASGSGKTYTILGTPTEPGIIPRSLDYLFRTLPKLPEKPSMKPLPTNDVIYLNDVSIAAEIESKQKLLNSKIAMDRAQHIGTFKLMEQRMSSENAASFCDTSSVKFSIWVSFFEIYNEYVYDLLKLSPARGQNRPSLRIAEDSEGNTYVKDLTCLNVTSSQEAYELMQFGKYNLKYASTSVNTHSSRSHCIFTIKLIQSDSKGSKVRVSRFNLCDLAGSERAKKTCNKGDRMKESNNINTSLMVLGRCLQLIVKTQTNNHSVIIPYRDSKLTRLIKQALSGNEYISMIVNINPKPSLIDETQHVLNFSAIAKNIIIEAVPVVKTNNKRLSRFSLYMQNQQEKDDPMIKLSFISESVTENETMQNLILENQELKEQLLKKKMEMEIKEREIRREISKVFNDLMKKKDNLWEKQLKETKEELERKHKMEIEELEDLYEKNNAKRQRINSSCSDSDDDVVEDFAVNNRFLQDENIELRNELKLTKDKITDLQEQLNEKELLLQDAILEYNELEMEKKLYTRKYLDLKAKYLHLEEEIDLQNQLEAAKKLKQNDDTCSDIDNEVSEEN